MTKKELAILGGAVAIGAALTQAPKLRKEHQALLIVGGVLTILQAL